MQSMRRWGAVAPAASVLRTMARPSATGTVSPFAAAVNACFDVENAMGLLSVRCDSVRDTATMPVPLLERICVLGRHRCMPAACS